IDLHNDINLCIRCKKESMLTLRMSILEKELKVADDNDSCIAKIVDFFLFDCVYVVLLEFIVFFLKKIKEKDARNMWKIFEKREWKEMRKKWERSKKVFLFKKKTPFFDIYIYIYNHKELPKMVEEVSSFITSKQEFAFLLEPDVRLYFCSNCLTQQQLQ
ncbi:hypothetical protein RFI_22293, partial [Reticulomyxa filosa]